MDIPYLYDWISNRELPEGTLRTRKCPFRRFKKLIWAIEKGAIAKRKDSTTYSAGKEPLVPYVIVISYFAIAFPCFQISA